MMKDVAGQFTCVRHPSTGTGSVSRICNMQVCVTISRNTGMDGAQIVTQDSCVQRYMRMHYP